MRTSFNVPDDVLAEFDRVWQAEGIENRSRAVREAMLEYVGSHARLATTTGEAVALVDFDHRHHEVVRELHSVSTSTRTSSSTRATLTTGEWCLESLFRRGAVERVRELTYRLRDFDAVRRVKVMVIRDDAER